MLGLARGLSGCLCCSASLAVMVFFLLPPPFWRASCLGGRKEQREREDGKKDAPRAGPLCQDAAKRVLGGS